MVLRVIDLKIYGFIITFIGALFYANTYFMLDLNVWIYASVLIGLSSLNTAYYSLQSNIRGLLAWGTIIFLASVFVFVNTYFEITSFTPFVLPAIFFVSAILFLMLYIENPQVKPFVPVSITSLIIGSALIYFTDTLFINQINQYIDIAFDYPYLIAFITALVLIISSDRNL